MLIDFIIRPKGPRSKKFVIVQRDLPSVPYFGQPIVINEKAYIVSGRSYPGDGTPISVTLNRKK